MACTSCAKKKINIQPASETDLTTLEYTGKNVGGTIRGITGKSYAINVYRDKAIIQKVHPQDAADFIRKGLFKALPKTEKRSTVIVSPTPQKVEVVEVSREERLKKQNEELLKIRAESQKFVEELLGEVQPQETVATLEETQWYDTPQDYTVSQLKNMIDREQPNSEQLETLYDNEAMSEKPRKTLLKFVSGKLT